MVDKKFPEKSNSENNFNDILSYFDIDNFKNFMNKHRKPYQFNSQNGAGSLELQGISPEVFANLPNQHLCEMRKLIPAPAMENMSVDEKLDYLCEEGFLTTRVIYDMIINTYSHIRQRNHEVAEKQLGILRAVDLPSVLEGDIVAQRIVRKAISNLSQKIMLKF